MDKPSPPTCLPILYVTDLEFRAGAFCAAATSLPLPQTVTASAYSGQKQTLRAVVRKAVAHAHHVRRLFSLSILPNVLPLESSRARHARNACLPRNDTEHGLQYVTVKKMRADAILEEGWDYDIFGDNYVFDPNLEGYEEEFGLGNLDNSYIKLQALERARRPSEEAEGKPSCSEPRVNKSACLWDAGIWTACKESRMVITEHLDLSGWTRLRRGSSQPAWYDKTFPSTLVPHPQDRSWRPIVMPSRDIFCIDTGNLRSVPKSLYSLKLLAPFIATKHYTVRENWAIALKFDSSWNERFPKYGSGLY
ncbi:hypothetical protein FGRMN_3502 [Fusarium graminum]|nr:hypothetical protein FGRMN_3502 [Fusarium graminum]